MTYNTKFDSRFVHLGTIEFPEYTGVRIMMMPFRLDDIRSVPIDAYKSLVSTIMQAVDSRVGVAYLTIDEAEVKAGETHRRPGLHVDGIGPDGSAGGWGGQGGGWSSSGMYVAASILGSRGWNQTFLGWPGANGCCAHLEPQLEKATDFQANQLYYCNALTVHTSVPLTRNTKRQFIRLSMPSLAPWYHGYTENPLGVKPTGPIHPRRHQMNYRP